MSRPKNIEPRDQQLNLCLTATELASIKQRAAALGMRPAHWGRARLLGDDGKAPAMPSQKAAGVSNPQLLAYHQLARIGNNLNQLMRHLHQTGEPAPADLAPLLRDIRQILAGRAG